MNITIAPLRIDSHNASKLLPVRGRIPNTGLLGNLGVISKSV
jgi:hypothetical protein